MFQKMQEEPTRFDVFVAIEKERQYQDQKWGGREHDEGHTLQDWLEMMSERMRLALDRAVPEPEAALDQLRKIAAMAVACMEVHGFVPRKGSTT